MMREKEHYDDVRAAIRELIARDVPDEVVTAAHMVVQWAAEQSLQPAEAVREAAIALLRWLDDGDLLANNENLTSFRDAAIAVLRRLAERGFMLENEQVRIAFRDAVIADLQHLAFWYPRLSEVIPLVEAAMAGEAPQ
jgi:hypothetical protein